MKVVDLRCASSGDKASVCATVIWEDCDRPQKDIYIETSAQFSDDISPDPNYSSASLAILHDGLAYSRIDKMHLLKDWVEGLSVLRVCADPLRTDLKMNCGFCEKCIRTKISLLTLGILDQCPTFEENDVTADDIDLLWTTAPKPGASPFGYMSYGSHHFWEMMLQPVKAMGRSDLVSAIERKIAEHGRFRAGSIWKGRIKLYDQQLLGGTIRKTIRVLRGKPAR